jgi:hypothetical protein
MSYATTQITITGFLVGDIWMPCTEAWREVRWDATAYEARCVDSRYPDEPVRLTLREHVDALVTHEGGDFRGCDLADGWLTIERRNGASRHVRDFPLAMFPSIADMRRDDWEGPVHFEDEEDAL